MTTSEIIGKLKAGNQKYVSASQNDGDISASVREDTATNGQHPYAVVIACADSRVVPEAIFMAGLGELFVIRVAGNVIAGSQLGSIEYAVEHLGCKVVLILGHTKCGAVGAALEGGGTGYVKSITDGILKAIGSERDEYKASCLNVKQGVDIVRSKLQSGVAVVGAVYDVADGHVDWLYPQGI